MARQLLSSYRRDDYADPNAFLLQMGQVFERYPDEVIRLATSAVTGIQRQQLTHQGPPTIADIVSFCDTEQVRLNRIRRFTAMGELRKVNREPQHRANVLVRADAPQYRAMLAKAEAKDKHGNPTADEMDYRLCNEGIWVALGWLERNGMAKFTSGLTREKAY